MNINTLNVPMSDVTENMEIQIELTGVPAFARRMKILKWLMVAALRITGFKGTVAVDFEKCK